MEEVGESQAKLTIDRPDSPGSVLSARASPSAERWPETAELRPLGEFPIESTSEATFEATCEAELTEEDPDARLARAIAQARRTEERMLSWLRDAKSVREWASALNLETLLAKTDGIVSIPDFFPDFVAEGALQAIRRVHSREWQLSRKQEYGDADHSFRANDTADTIPEIIRALSNLFPALTPTFSAGRYSRADHIAAHVRTASIGRPRPLPFRCPSASQSGSHEARSPKTCRTIRWWSRSQTPRERPRTSRAT